MNCKICGKELKSNRALKNHLVLHDRYTTKQYYDEFLKKPEEGFCEICKKPTKYYGMKRGYARFCGKSHASKSTNDKPEVRKKIKQTLLTRYGNENYVNYEKCRETKKERYGYEWFPEDVGYLTSDEELKRVRNILQTKKERYGSQSYCNKEKIAQTKLARHGNSGYNNPDSIRETWKSKSADERQEIYQKRSQRRSESKIDFYKEIIKDQCEIISVSPRKFILKCLKCGKEYEIQNQLVRRRLHNKRDLCVFCNPLDFFNVSVAETEVYEFVRSNTDKEIQRNTRKIISKELDVYIPELRLAIDYNGLYWHCELNLNSEYHFNKTNECEENGIHLIHIYEDDWQDKKEIVQSRLLNLLGKSKKIYGRDCEIREIDNAISKEFIGKNHLQNFTRKPIALALG